MHVLQLSWEFPPHVVGGMGRHVAELAPALAGAGLRVSVVTPQLRGGPADETLPGGVRVHRVPLTQDPGADYPVYVAQASRDLERAAAELGPFDLIHAHDWLTAEAAGRLKHHWRVPLVATIHATERGRGRGHLSGRAAHQINDQEWLLTYEAWRVIVCSHFMAAQVGEYFHTPPDKVDVVPNGVAITPDPFAGPGERLAFRRRYAADDERLIFHVGRIVYEKGLHVLLDAWPAIAAHNARLLIAGTGGYLDALQSQVEAAGLSASVRFAGFVSDEDRDSMYRVADVAVFPSLYEPFGIVALESFAACCPLVVSDAGGLAEVVRHGETGLVARAGDAAALAAAVVESLRRPAEAHARANAAFLDVRGHYTWDRIADSTTAVYRKVMREWQAGSWGR
jgi:glycosyltransferase involved in cell wall biosynthesis